MRCLKLASINVENFHSNELYISHSANNNNDIIPIYKSTDYTYLKKKNILRDFARKMDCNIHRKCFDEEDPICPKLEKGV